MLNQPIKLLVFLICVFFTPSPPSYEPFDVMLNKESIWSGLMILYYKWSNRYCPNMVVLFILISVRDFTKFEY